MPDDPNLPDPLVPGKLPGMALLEELSRGATQLGGTKPAQPALMTVPHSSPAAFPVAKGCGDWESCRSQECHLPHSPVPLASRPTLAKMSQGLVAIDAGTAALQHCMHGSAQQAGQARLDGEIDTPMLLAATLCHWQELLDFWIIYLIPVKGTVGPMDLSDFDIPAGGPRERVSKTGMLPVLLHMIKLDKLLLG